MDLMQEISLLIAQLTDEMQDAERKYETERNPLHKDYLSGQLDVLEDVKERLENIYKE